MVITFCGHSHVFADNLEEQILEIVRKWAKNEPIYFYLGGYGEFDNIARHSCLKYKKENPNCFLVFVTPYLDETYLKNREILKDGYDEIVYPSLEKTPKQYAILKRNQWMVKNADLVIAFVKYSFGGASKTLEYAQKLKKQVINLANF